jgi:hypothetical protein
VPARRVVHIPGKLDVWTGPLSDGDAVVVLVNYEEGVQTMSFAATAVDYYGEHIQVEDLWTGQVTKMVDGL